MFTTRGRLGWVIQPSILAFVTGGLAVSHISSANSYSDTSGVAAAWNASATKTGWTVGGGVEYALNQHWSARAECLFVHFDAITASGVVSTPIIGGYASAISTTTDLSAHIARAGINYKF